MTNNTPITLATIALIVSVLTAGYVTLAHTQTSLEQETKAIAQDTQEEFMMFAANAEQEWTLIKARAQVAFVRTQIVAGENFEDAQAQIAQVQAEIEMTANQAEQETRAELLAIAADMQTMQDRLAEATADQVDSLQSGLEAIEVQLNAAAQAGE